VRLWSLHPRYLDPAGLVALWREGLLARKVLRGRTTGYRHHPQLARFRAAPRPVASIDTYLAAVCDEADRRGYRFDRTKIGRTRTRARLPVSDGQLAYEWAHLLAKLEQRRPDLRRALAGVTEPGAHPLFRVVRGPVAAWERVTGGIRLREQGS
jgi:hypothetical protein